jgi:hypothetical protein
VQMRTRIMNQLHALAMNEGYRWKRKLFSEPGRVQLEKLTLGPWATRRRHELLELLDRMNPTIEELPAAIEREARKRPESPVSEVQGQTGAGNPGSSWLFDCPSVPTKNMNFRIFPPREPGVSRQIIPFPFR